MAAPFWSDGFDMDLPAVLPTLDVVLGDTADTPLWTHGGTTHGRLNHPAVWDAAYFGTDDTGGWRPDHYYTHHGLVACTWREATRDAWAHQYLLLVDGVAVWDTRSLWPVFEALMYHRRGWRTHDRVPRLQQVVLESVAAATGRLRRVLRTKPTQSKTCGDAP